MRSGRSLTRRHFLRGAGVALALPWLESLEPRHARGAPASRLRFVPVYFPMGTAPFWEPPSVGGTTLVLSPILSPLATVMSRLTVLSGVSNTAYGANDPAPSLARETGSFLTCVAAQGGQNGKSVDQVIADGLSANSLQLGLSTTVSPDAGLEASFARSISWRDAATPMFKIVNPQAAFDRIVSMGPLVPLPDPAAAARRATQKSVLDFVLDDAASVQKRLSRSDRARLDRFQTSVRSLELRIQQTTVLAPACRSIERPSAPIDVGSTPPDYDRNAHADLMIDLMVMALSCDSARVISLMLDDGGSDFVYDFLPERNFTDGTLGTTRVGGTYRDLATGQGDPARGYATINLWFATKVASLCRKLVGIDDGAGRNVLDNSLIWFGSGMHDGQSRSPAALPLAYAGGGGFLKAGQHLDLKGTRSLSDIYLTLIQNVFGIAGVPTFGDSKATAFEIIA